MRDEGVSLARMAVLYRNHHDSILLQAELVSRGVPYTVRSGLRFFEQAHIKDVLAYCRILANPRDEPAWRRLLLLLPGIGPAKGSAICGRLIEAPDPLAALATAETMALVPAKSKGFFAGFVADLRKVEKTQPRGQPGGGHRRDPPGGLSRHREAPATSGPTTGSPTSSSSPSSPPATPAWSG